MPSAKKNPKEILWTYIVWRIHAARYIVYGYDPMTGYLMDKSTTRVDVLNVGNGV